MTLRLPFLALFAAAAVLLAPEMASACKGGCDEAEKAKVKVKDAPAEDAAHAAKCNCTGPSDCTCKKGECKCKKCDKDHRHHGSEKSTRLVPELKGQSKSPALPASAPLDASSGHFI